MQLVSAVDVARLTLVGSRDDLMRPCFEALQDHPDLYLTPLMRQLYTAEPPLVAGLLMQVANLQDLESLRQITEGHCRDRPCVIALATPDYYLPALEAGAVLRRQTSRLSRHGLMIGCHRCAALLWAGELWPGSRWKLLATGCVFSPAMA